MSYQDDLRRRVGDSTAVFYLARGADEDAQKKFLAFCTSYQQWPAGIPHVLYVIYKGFTNGAQLATATKAFHGLPHRAIYVDDAGFDLKAYFTVARQVVAEKVCFLNTASRLCGPNWLLKLALNLAADQVGLVGCTASYEAPQHPGRQNAPFPNPHIRSNAFMIERTRFLALRCNNVFADKTDAHVFEHGIDGMSRQIQAQGLRLVLVGRNGRGYDTAWWPRSQTFRQGTQANLLVTDNQTAAYDDAIIGLKRVLFNMSWGPNITGRSSIQEDAILSASTKHIGG